MTVTIQLAVYWVDSIVAFAVIVALPALTPVKVIVPLEPLIEELDEIDTTLESDVVQVIFELSEDVA